MAVSSRKEIRDNVISTTNQNSTQIGDLVNDYINLTIQEINNPAIAFRDNTHHLWSWLRRKTTFSTVASTAEYVLPREVDYISILRQTTSPQKLIALTDEFFLKRVPDPTTTGNPLYYREWETEGVSTRLSSATSLNVVSSSSSDSGSSQLSVSIVGYVGGILTNETYQLNGTTTVSGSKTFQAREIFVSKQKDTTGDISIKKNSDSSTILTLGAKERNPRFKVISLYPIPSSVMTVYLEFYTTIRELTDDSDVPQFNQKWHYIVRLGTLAKVYQKLNKTEDFNSTQALYMSALRSMVAADKTSPDLIEYMEGRYNVMPAIWLQRSTDAIA